MKPVFEIIPEAIFFHETNLICEISRDGFSYVFENSITRKFHGLSVFYFNDEDIPGRLKEIFNEQPLLHKKYKKVFISYSGEESTLLPEELYKPGENELLLDTLYGDLHESTVATDLVAGKKIYNVYRMPSAIHKVLAEQFPLAAFSHHHSMLIKKNAEVTDLLKVIFYKENFITVLMKCGALQFIHTYPYTSGADVVYHLLNIGRQFNMENVQLQTGGMIDMDSDLHKELQHYFPRLTFDPLPEEYEFTDSLKAIPPHYFSHLYSLALCV